MDIEVTALSKRFGAVAAVSGLTFRARAGRVTGFLGRNGAGKSTTLRCLTGLIRPDEGTLTVGGRPYPALPCPARTVGVALDPEAHHPDRSGRNHLLALADAAGIGAHRVEAVLADVELTAAADRRAGGYSLGMRQRLHLAAALLGDPPVLVLDEPTNGLDPQGIRWLRDFLRAYAARGRTVLLSSHQLPEVDQTVDDVVVIAAGRLVAAGPLGEVLAAGPPRLTVRSTRAAALAVLLRGRGAEVTEDTDRLVVAGADAATVAGVALDERILITELSPVRPDLERRFFELTEAGR